MKNSRIAKIVFSSLVTAVTLLSLGCSYKQQGLSKGLTTKISDPTMPIEVKIGQEFVINLESNPNTSYHWQLAEPVNEDILQVIKSGYKSKIENLAGADGQGIWVFKAVKQGKTKISFKYMRWQTEFPVAKTHNYVVLAK